MDQENLRRWRLVLGDDGSNPTGCVLSEQDLRMDAAMAALYGGNGGSSYGRAYISSKKGGKADQQTGSSRQGGLGASAPGVSRWLGDIREMFPQTVVQVMQKDAIERLNLKSLLMEKEVLETIVPDINLVTTLMSLSHLISDKNKEAARFLVKKLVDELTKKLQDPMHQAITGALSRAIRRRNPKFKDIDWNETIKRNLKNYQPDYKTIIPEIRIGHGRKGQSLKDIVLCIDQSGSMGSSVVYSSIFGAVMASIPAVSTRFIAFDTAVVDLTDKVEDPVDILFGVQLGGGTDIAKVLGYTQGVISRPNDTVLVVITDLYEGGDEQLMKRRFLELQASGVTVVVLLALSDDGAAFYDRKNAQYLANMGIPAFACTPDKFPELMGAVLNHQDLGMWVSENISEPQKDKIFTK